MADLHPDIDAAIEDILAGAVDQTPEFKRRLRKLIENATIGNLVDNDVREVIELAVVDENLED
ncbi:hypothetical protein [Shumkonia mesophila]|uniref:hypothetical protein n=1 Tax=Shumkonia mesophila TaxID=2838854 RepID=UPI0029345D99|nr:hypothetical protein [Shumkonia mesophila]